LGLVALGGLALPLSAADPLATGAFQWRVSGPWVGPAERPADPCVALKDPTVVFHEGRWHLFCTIRSRVRTHQIEYLSFRDWAEADRAERHVLTMAPGYFCAPQVFYYTPHRLWYMVYQAANTNWTPGMQPVFSTTRKLADPNSWTPPQRLYETPPPGPKGWIDFWVICDAAKAHLFYTSLNGKMWRAETRREDFPKGWSVPQVALEADIFEASHTYRVAGRDQYLTLVEAQDGGRRYYKAFLADRLEGPWQALAATREKPFAGLANCRFDGREPWTQSFSHGEWLRTGVDERLEISLEKPRFLFQGVTDRDRQGKKYGEIPWRLGLLEGVE
jgi:hypothetical protein